MLGPALATPLPDPLRDGPPPPPLPLPLAPVLDGVSSATAVLVRSTRIYDMQGQARDTLHRKGACAINEGGRGKRNRKMRGRLTIGLGAQRRKADTYWLRGAACGTFCYGCGTQSATAQAACQQWLSTAGRVFRGARAAACLLGCSMASCSSAPARARRAIASRPGRPSVRGCGALAGVSNLHVRNRQVRGRVSLAGATNVHGFSRPAL